MDESLEDFTLYVEMPEELLEALEQQAILYGMTVSDFVLHVIGTTLAMKQA